MMPAGRPEPPRVLLTTDSLYCPLNRFCGMPAAAKM